MSDAPQGPGLTLRHADGVEELAALYGRQGFVVYYGKRSGSAGSPSK